MANIIERRRRSAGDMWTLHFNRGAPSMASSGPNPNQQ